MLGKNVQGGGKASTYEIVRLDFCVSYVCFISNITYYILHMVKIGQIVATLLGLVQVVNGGCILSNRGLSGAIKTLI